MRNVSLERAPGSRYFLGGALGKNGTTKSFMMDLTTEYIGNKSEITQLVETTFTASEGATEGALISAFLDKMLGATDAEDLLVCSALQAGGLVGVAVFTRIRFSQDARSVFILSPMAVATAQQGHGIGKTLLTFGLNTLKQTGVDVVLTYGDVNFYSKVGFRQITVFDAEPPMPLSYPEGWLGQSLTSRPLDTLQGSSTCVSALNDPALW